MEVNSLRCQMVGGNLSILPYNEIGSDVYNLFLSLPSLNLVYLLFIRIFDYINNDKHLNI